MLQVELFCFVIFFKKKIYGKWNISFGCRSFPIYNNIVQTFLYIKKIYFKSISSWKIIKKYK